MKQLMSRLKVLAFKATREGKIAASSVMDFTFWKLGLFGKGGKSVSGRKKIVFVGEFLPPRIARISKWLRKTGDFETILVCSGHGFVDKFSGNNFDAIHLFRNRYHQFMFMHQHRDAWMMHGFGPKSEYPDHARMQFSKIPFVHDMQDVLVTYYGTNPPLRWARRELPHERNCLEFAQGVVCHSLEPREGFKRFNIVKRPPTLYFPLYCDDEMFRDNTGKNLDGEIHLVYAGGVAGSHRPKAQYGNIQFAWLIETLSHQKIHFHIYPSPSNIKADYEEYEQMAKANPFFHYHEPVAQENLSTELSKYHFGLLPFFLDSSDQSATKYKYATTLKLFNYIEAGLPVMVSPDLYYQSWVLNHYEAGILARRKDYFDLRPLITGLPYETRVKKLLAARHALALSNQIPRLIKLYENAVSRKKTQ
jgi:hypothetical protein